MAILRMELLLAATAYNCENGVYHIFDIAASSLLQTSSLCSQKVSPGVLPTMRWRNKAVV